MGFKTCLKSTDFFKGNFEILSGNQTASSSSGVVFSSHGPATSQDDNDLIKPGRITMKPTTEQLALVKACKAGIASWPPGWFNTKLSTERLSG